MQIITDKKGHKYVDKDLFDYIKNIWVSYDIVIPDNSNLYFCKNCTVNRLITDYSSTSEIRRVTKKEKTQYALINRFEISSYPQFYNPVTGNISDDSEQEPVFGIYNLPDEVKLTIDNIVYFIDNKIEVKYVNQDKLNESINNGFVIDENNYSTIRELLLSDSEDNNKLAVTMLRNSDIKANMEWILYLLHENQRVLKYDEKNTIQNLFKANNIDLYYYVDKFDASMGKITNEIVKEKMLDTRRSKFLSQCNKFFVDFLKSSKIELLDFKIKYSEKA